ncbi:non-ribosomal peptide synthetase, partial [Dyella mobilis]
LIGFFVNTLALRMDLSQAPSVAELLARVRQTALSAQDHQDLPFEQVVEIAQPPRCLDHTPLFQVMFAWQNNEAGELELPGLQLVPIALAGDTIKFDLELHLNEEGGTIHGALFYATALFDAATIERYRGYLLSVLQAMVADAHVPVSRIDLLGTEERELLLHTWNQTDAPYPKDQCIHQLFEQQVLRTPDATAVVFEDQSLSYAQLNAQANRLAHYLRSLGVEADGRVAICAGRSMSMVIGILAILKAGGVYVPLDPTYPKDRLVHLLKDSAPQLILAEGNGMDALRGVMPEMRRVDLRDDAAWAWRPGKDFDPLQAMAGAATAYVMYTSGSTGIPKGVAVLHRSIARLVINNGYADFNAEDRVAFAANPAFDASTLELWAPLLHGGTLVIFDHATVLEPARFARALLKQRISVLWLTVGLFNQCVDALKDVIPGLRYLIVGGDALDPKIIRQVQTQFPPRYLLNGYGPTETTTFAACYAIPRELDGHTSIPIGRPIGNTRIYLLDAHGQPVPLGAPGEIYIGGAGVASGYLNRPDLTAERFLDDPFSPHPDARMYRTGDLARYLSDGNLEFLGRNDHQIKIRGFRIELGEIEACLAEHPLVCDAVVTLREDALGDKRLVAYVTTMAGTTIEAGDLVASLRAHAGEFLPDYMLPSAFVQLTALPLTPNGKLDRQMLPIPDGEAYVRRVYEPPQGDAEQTIAILWEELLGVERIGRYDNFFELGGHSLLAVQLIHRARELSLRLTFNDLFQNPVLHRLAAQIENPSQWLDGDRAIPVRTTGTQTPIFFLPTGTGDRSYIFSLAKDISKEHPIYGLPWPSMEEGVLPTLEAMAPRLIAMMQAVQPQGPYRLIGYSAGGLLAHAIASDLLRAKQPVSFLGLIDTYLYADQKIRHPKKMIVDFVGSRYGDHAEAVERLRRLETDLSLDDLIKEALELKLLQANHDVRGWKQVCYFLQAAFSYQASDSSLTVHLFCASDPLPEELTLGDADTHAPDKEAIAQQRPVESWHGALPAASMHVIPIPGDHLSMVSEPDHRRVLGAAISDVLEKPA